MEDYSESNDELSVTVTINELCLNDTNYLVLVIFGTRPSVNDDCIDQEKSVPKNISSGDSETFAVSVTLEDGYIYCYTIIVNGVCGEYIYDKQAVLINRTCSIYIITKSESLYTLLL